MPARTPEAIARMKERKKAYYIEYRKRPEVIAAARERARKSYYKQKAEGTLKKRPHVAKPKKAKRGPAPVLVGKMRSTVARSERIKPKDERPVVTPAHIRIQHCPSSKDTRYSVPAGFVGEFQKQWRVLRGAHE